MKLVIDSATVTELIVDHVQKTLGVDIEGSLADFDDVVIDLAAPSKPQEKKVKADEPKQKPKAKAKVASKPEPTEEEVTDGEESGVDKSPDNSDGDSEAPFDANAKTPAPKTSTNSLFANLKKPK